MSEDEKPKEEDKESQTDVSQHVQTVSLEKIISRPESSGITINFYPPSYTPRSDKPVQTDTFDANPLLKPSVPSNTRSRKLASESREIRSFEYSHSRHKKINTPPHEPRQNKFMNAKKFSENKITTKAINDLERKKLEAELKATEEIAKIQQTVIEKRLALELASLQDGNDFHHKNPSPAQSAAQEEMRVLEELRKKQKLLEYSLARERESARENSPRSQPPRPAPLSRPSLAEAPKLGSPKTETNFVNQNSSEMNPLRHLIEKKLNLEVGGSRPSDLKASPPPSSHRERFPSYPENPYGGLNPNMPAYPAQDQPGCSPYAMRHSKNHSLWKSAVIKIKKKIKHAAKPPPPWE